MKRFFVTVMLCAAVLAAFGAETPKAAGMLETGDVVPELSGAWSKGSPVRFAEQRGKNAVVLYFWAVNQATLEDMPRFAAAARKYQDKPVTFVGVGCDRVDKVTGFFLVRDLPMSILVDDRFLVRDLFLQTKFRLPAAAIVDREGRLVWRGAPTALPVVLDKVLDGSFDVKEHIRREKFAEKVKAALVKNHYEEAVALIDDELKTHPANVELVQLKASILARALKQPELALKAMDEALKTAPREIAFHEIKMKLLCSMRDESGLERFYADLCRVFADQPLVLVRFANVEMGRPIVDNRPEFYRMLMTAARDGKGFKDDRERGIVEFAYSRMLLMCGRPELAAASAERAVELLDKAPERKEAETFLAFCRRVAKTAKRLKK